MLFYGMSQGSPRMSHRVFLTPFTDRLFAVALPVALLIGGWELAVQSEAFSDAILVPPQRVFETFVELMKSGELGGHLRASLLRVLAGFSIGGAIGLIFGLLLGLLPGFERASGVIFHALRQVPVIAWAPLLLIVLGIGESFKIVVIAYAALFPVALNTLDGVRNVPAPLRDVATLFQFSRAALIRYVVLPGALPSILTGFRLALSRSWMMVVAAELFASSEGLGYMMNLAREMFQIDVIMVGIVLTGLIGFLFDQLLRVIEARFSPWMPKP